MATKTKMWRILEMLLETDEHYPLTAKEIEKKLAAQDIVAERKSIYRDINTIRNECGFDICLGGGEKRGYYLAQRDFEDWELKLLIDAVLEMKFLPRKDMVTLVAKLQHLGSKYTREVLKSITPLRPTTRPENKRLRFSIDKLLTAIKEHRQILFKYTYIQPDGSKTYRREGRRYRINPYALVLRDGIYYLICNYVKYDDLSYYRLDRMEDVRTTSYPRRPLEDLLGADASKKMSAFVNRSTFRFTGPDITLSLAVPKMTTDILLYHFGTEDVSLKPLEDPDEYGFDYQADIKIQYSEGLYFWLLQQADNVRILGPEYVRDEFTAYVRSVLDMYE